MTRWRAPVLGLAALVTAAGCGSADALPEGVESAAAPLSTAYPYFDATGSFGIPPGWGYRVKATQPRTGKRTLGVAMSGRAVKMLDGGATLLAGEAGDGAGQTCAVLAKLDGLGDPDSNFGSLGAAPHQACSPNTTVGAIAVQSDGKVLVAGRMVISGAHQFFVARWTSTGGIDDRFGSGGVARFSSAVGPLVGYAVAVQPSGEIVVGGDYGLARFSAMGVSESTYGTNGLARLPGGQVCTSDTQCLSNLCSAARCTAPVLLARSIVVDDSGATMAALNQRSVGGGQYTGEVIVVRFDASGQPDSSFGQSGPGYTRFPSLHGTLANGVATGLIRDSGGRLVASGYETFDSPPPRRVLQKGYIYRLTSTGAVDTSFGNHASEGAGRAEVAQGDQLVLEGLVEHPNHAGYLAAGRQRDPGAAFNSIAIASLDSSGLPVQSFGTDGLFRADDAPLARELIVTDVDVIRNVMTVSGNASGAMGAARLIIGPR